MELKGLLAFVHEAGGGLEGNQPSQILYSQREVTDAAES